MPLRSDDRLLWLVLSAGILVAANTIPRYLKYVRTLAEVDPDKESAKKGPCERAEEKLKLKTLQKLAEGPNYRLRSSAIKIIAERATQKAARSQLLQDVASANPQKRGQALSALWFLLTHPSLQEGPRISKHFTGDVTALAAIIQCLINLLPLHKNDGPARADNPTAASPLLPHSRPPSEALALRILHDLLPSMKVSSALEVGLVSRWLQYYPFPCSLPENGGRRQDVALHYNNSWGQDDTLISSIRHFIAENPRGRTELCKYGLDIPSRRVAQLNRAAVEAVSTVDGRDDARMHETAVTAASLGSQSHPPSDSSWAHRPPNPSTSSPDQTERAIRQRRREAAVYSEGNAPLTQDNIFQRQPSSTHLAPPPASF